MTRRNLRRVVSVRFVKQFDDYNNAYFWLDQETGKTTWEKPEVSERSERAFSKTSMRVTTKN